MTELASAPERAESADPKRITHWIGGQAVAGESGRTGRCDFLCTIGSMARPALFLICTLIAGCAPPQSPSSADATARASVLLPQDPRLASLYQQSCRSCHAVPGTGAPLTGDRSQWDARWAKGLPLLLQNTVAGLNGMPPGGQCFSCSAADYEALIRFLSGRT